MSKRFEVTEGGEGGVRWVGQGLYLISQGPDAYWLKYDRAGFPYHPSTHPRTYLRETEQMASISFQPILDTALADYTKQLGIDLATHSLADSLRLCRSPDDVLMLLEDKAKEFQDFRNGNRKLIDWLSPIIRVVHTLSGVLGRSITLVGRNNLVFSLFFFSPILSTGSVRTSKSHLFWSGCSPRGTHLSTVSCNSSL